LTGFIKVALEFKTGCGKNLTLREQTDAHAADTTTAMEDKRTCRRITQLAVEERDGGLLEWNATGTEHQLPSVDVMSAAWHADKVRARCYAGWTLTRVVLRAWDGSKTALAGSKSGFGRRKSGD
jgi:hypothetical protein